MADVDFSNARITPIKDSRNNLEFFYINLPNSSNPSFNIYDANSQSIGTLSFQVITNEQKQLVIIYSGSFTASGTEFYMAAYSGARWKISNISFQNGDTFLFKVRADLVCQ